MNALKFVSYVLVTVLKSYRFNTFRNDTNNVFTQFLITAK